jgi:hypothetical protein
MDMGEYASDIIMFVTLGGSLAVMMACEALLPLEYARPVGGFLYLATALGGIVGSSAYASLASAPHPCLKAIVRPDNSEYYFFIDKDKTHERKVGEDSHVGHFALAYPVKVGEFGKVKEFILLYRGRWSERVSFRPGWVMWKGIRTKHAQTEVVEVMHAQKSNVMIDHAEPIPVFYLRSASKDTVVSNPSPVLFDDASMPAAPRIASLERENVDLRAKVAEWQQRALSLEEVVTQQRSEIQGLLDAKTGIKEHAYEIMLGFSQAFGSFDKALSALRGGKFRFSFTKWVAATIIACVAIAYLWMNPQVASQIGLWLSNPVNFIAVAAVAALIAYILWKVKK